MAEIKNGPLKTFSEDILQARLLSKPRVDSVGNAEGYRRLLDQNRIKIASIAKKNDAFIDNILKPFWESDDLLSATAVKSLEQLCDSLLVSWPEEDLDLSIHFFVSQKLYRDALIKGDDDEIIRHGSRFMTSCYNNLNRVNRVRTTREFTEFFKKKGLETAKVILSYLDKDRFRRLIDKKSMNTVLSFSRFYLALYDTWYATDETENEERIDGLVRSIALADDPWYTERTVGYNWLYHRLRGYEHMGQLTENGNQWKMTKAQCVKIMHYMDEMKRLWEEDEEKSNEKLPRIHMELIYFRNAFYSGRIGSDEYRQKLLDLYKRYANADYDMYSVLANLFIPAEYLSSLEGEWIDEAQEDILLSMYKQIAAYVLASPGNGSFSFMLEYLNIFLERFIDIPGRYEFEEMALNCLAAMDPESYIYSVQTAHIARALCTNMLDVSPERFIGLFDCKNTNDVFIRHEMILNKIYHAGCIHAVGRLSVMDTVLTCGRSLQPAEKLLLEKQQDMSIRLLSAHHSTQYAADIIKNTDSCDDVDIPVMSYILATASHIVKAFDEGYSTKEMYEQDVYGLRSVLEMPGIREDLSFILERGRENRYLDMWLMLKEVQKGEIKTLVSQLKGYIMRTERIRELSAPQSDEVKDPSEYERMFLQQFNEIGQMAAQNKETLAHTLFPLIESKEHLSAEEFGDLVFFCSELLSGQNLCDIDQGLVYLVSRRLLAEAKKYDDVDILIRQLDIHITSCYEMAHQAKRMHTASDIVSRYRNEGLDAAKEIWSFCEKDKFLKISEESRRLVVINMRYALYLYDTSFEEKDINELFINRLIDSFKLGDGAFYMINSPGVDWIYHKIRCIEYMGQATECGNLRRFDKNLCKKILNYVEELPSIINTDRINYEAILPNSSVRLMNIRTRYFAELTDILTYRNELWDIFRSKKNYDYDFNSVFANLVAPLEYIISFDQTDSIDPDEKDRIAEIYSWIIEYAAHTKNNGSYALLLEYLSEFLFHFKEIDGLMNFEQVGLYCMAALHPPTYIHSNMVGDLSRCICKYLIRKNPSLFVGSLGFETAEDVVASEERISEFAYHNALCHDFGKITMMDTIFVYGRNLLDHEFALIKHHGDVGYMILSAHESTKKYADVARGHHKWYDGTRGYPEEYDTASSPYKIFTDIVSVADCMDAATDTVGRSYTGSKTTESILAEIQAGGGTRYNPYIANLLGNEDFRSDIAYILKNVRNENYRKTYSLLKEFLEKDNNA